MSRRKLAASVTVPLCLVLSVLAVLILGLAENARYYGLKADAGEWTNLAAESLFAGYEPVLLKEYGMFFWDGSFGTGDYNLEQAEGRVKMLLQENLAAKKGDGICVYRMQAEEARVAACRLACDEDGRVFEMQAANAMKQKIGQKAAEKIRNRILDTDAKAQEASNPNEAKKAAQEALDGLAEQTVREEDVSPKTPEDAATKNPIDTVKAIKRQGILALVMPEGKTVSGKMISVDNCLMKRNRYQGNFAQTKKPGWYERILMQEYVKIMTGNAIRPKEGAALSYGAEYLICGKGSDLENLKGTVKKLLALREGLNFLYLQQDAAKQAEALSVATAIAGVSANPLIIAAVKEGILAAWAYVESICDVKALLSGGKIALIKNASNWKSQLTGLAEAPGAAYAGESEGLSYENYLDTLLYAKSVKQIAYRCMDLMELRLKEEEGYSRCRMDAMVLGVRLKVKYSADTLFLGIFEEDRIGGYQFLEQTEYVYMQ